MTTPFITWGCVVGLFLIVVAVRSLLALHRSGAHRQPLFSIGSEREELFIPGDPDPALSDEYDEIVVTDEEAA